MKISAIILIVIGAVSIFIQNTFYGYIDNEGFVQDSIFLPLGVISIILGMLLMILWGIIAILKK